jgi:hypothetical protein
MALGSPPEADSIDLNHPLGDDPDSYNGRFGLLRAKATAAEREPPPT